MLVAVLGYCSLPDNDLGHNMAVMPGSGCVHAVCKAPEQSLKQLSVEELFVIITEVSNISFIEK